MIRLGLIGVFALGLIAFAGRTFLHVIDPEVGRTLDGLVLGKEASDPGSNAPQAGPMREQRNGAPDSLRKLEAERDRRVLDQKLRTLVPQARSFVRAVSSYRIQEEVYYNRVESYNSRAGEIWVETGGLSLSPEPPDWGSLMRGIDEAQLSYLQAKENYLTAVREVHNWYYEQTKGFRSGQYELPTEIDLFDPPTGQDELIKQAEELLGVPLY